MRIKVLTSLIIFTITNFLPISFNVAGLDYSSNTPIEGADASFIGEEANNQAGFSIDIAGDVNGDGYDDIIIGARDYSKTIESSGKTYIIFGKNNGWTRNVSLDHSDASFIGSIIDGKSGSNVCGLGDINGDGYNDMGIGTIKGSYYLIFGKPTGWINGQSLSDTHVIKENVQPDALFGNYAEGIGDIDNDGYDDLVISAPWDNTGGNQAGKAYLFYGRATEWPAFASDADATFTGRLEGDELGSIIAGNGDVNGDGHLDLLFSAYRSDLKGSGKGAVYLLLGNGTRYQGDYLISDVTQSVFHGERNYDFAGASLSITPDINGDNFDDILIGAPNYDDIGNGTISNGKVYLILGKKNVPPKEMDLMNADASFIGSSENSSFGSSISDIGDIDGDGYDDIIIGSPRTGKETGRIDILMGRKEGWVNNLTHSPVPMSFIGNQENSWFGYSLSADGDINGDGFNDIIVAAPLFDEGLLSDIGKIYTVFPSKGLPGSNISMIQTFSDEEYLNEITNILPDNQLYLQAAFEKMSPLFADRITVRVINEMTSTANLRVVLKETTADSGIFRGNLTVSGDRTDFRNKMIKVQKGDILNISLLNNPDIFKRLYIGDPISISPGTTDLVIYEDDPLSIEYNISVSNQSAEWSYSTNATWTTWDPVKHSLTGTPLNDDVGQYWWSVEVSDTTRRTTVINNTLTVLNTVPEILTADLTYGIESLPYYNDYNSSDDGQGTIHWSLACDANWLTIDTSSGELSGLPTDTGLYFVNVSVNDGNSGSAYHNFTLNVSMKNRPPEWAIVPTDSSISPITQYLFDVEAIDINDDKLIYSLSSTPTSHIAIDNESGAITWDASKDVTDLYKISLSAFDGELAIFHNFSITIEHEFVLELKSPLNNSKVFDMVDFQWDLIKPEINTTMQYTLLVGLSIQDIENAIKNNDPALLTYFIDISTQNHMMKPSLEGRYFWTVVAFRGHSDVVSTCTSGVWSYDYYYEMGNAPALVTDIIEAHVGDKISVHLNVYDSDPGDNDRITFTLVNGPDGLIVTEGGILQWKPGKDDLGNNTVNIIISDGRLSTNGTIVIIVDEKLNEDMDILSDPTTLFIVFIIMIIAIFFITQSYAQFATINKKRR